MIHRDEALFQSPSVLASDRPELAAYELKFVVDVPAAAAVVEWARRHLAPDPNADPDLDAAYRVTTLYFDTPDLDILHRRPAIGRRKFRARRYGSSDWICVESKSRAKGRGRKRRAAIDDGDLSRLTEAPGTRENPSVDAWAAQWFHDRLTEKHLRPTCRVEYRREAYVGTGPEGPMRLTLDHDLRGIVCGDWSVDTVVEGRPLLPGRVILELKFVHALPRPFKELVRAHRLNPTGVSKYRLCHEAWGRSSPSSEIAGA
ncbi:MAG: polyphosphate polymerase domain-containing protein [Phycisphaerales bacterium]|nr:polyphosphate polymerase domain-containing protein [Phycisphaerales bacterium]